MLPNKPIPIIVTGLLVLLVIVVIEYVRRDAGETKSVGSGMISSHLPEKADTPSKQNASPALKNDIRHLQDVVGKDSTNARVAFELARLLQDSHNSRDAARYYALGLKSDPHNDSARVDYSLCLYDLGRSAEALGQCKLVLRRHPVNPEALFNVGAIFANNGVQDSARAYWARLIAVHPKHELALRARENLKTLEGNSTSL